MNFNKTTKMVSKLGGIATGVVFLLFPFVALSETGTGDYAVLAPLPFMTGNTTNFGTYLPGIFGLAIGIGALLAFAAITFGGILYMTSDAISKKEDGKRYIENALWGLILVIGAWIILYTINPKILSFNLDLNLTPEPPYTGVVAGTCLSCVPLSGLPTSGSAIGKSISSSKIDSVVLFNEKMKSAGINWSITEGYPPSVVHKDPCHANGTCFDASISSPTAENINRFVAEAGSSGLVATYEVQTTEEFNALLKDGVRAMNIRVIPYATGPHFHVQ